MSPLATATAVQSLSLGGTDLVQPTDLSLLAGLTAVHGMVLYYATPATLQPLSSMHDLTSLQLGTSPSVPTALPGSRRCRSTC